MSRFLNPAEGGFRTPTFQDPSGLQVVAPNIAIGGIPGPGGEPIIPIGGGFGTIGPQGGGIGGPIPIPPLSGQGIIFGVGPVGPIRAQPIVPPTVPVTIPPIGHQGGGPLELPPIRPQPSNPPPPPPPPAKQPFTIPPAGQITITPNPRGFFPGGEGGGPLELQPLPRPRQDGGNGGDGSQRPTRTPVRGVTTDSEGNMVVQADPPPGIPPALTCPHCGGEMEGLPEDPWMGHAGNPGELGWHSNGAPAIRFADGTMAPETCSSCAQGGR